MAHERVLYISDEGHTEDVVQELSRYVIFPRVTTEPAVPTQEPLWCRNATLALIDFYKNNNEKLRRKQVLWDAMAAHIKTYVGKSFSAAQCENRFGTLKRAYKNVKDNNKKSGRGRRDFEFYKEMDDLLEKNHSIHPVLVLEDEDQVPDIELACPSTAANDERPTEHAGPSGISVFVNTGY